MMIIRRLYYCLLRGYIRRLAVAYTCHASPEQTCLVYIPESYRQTSDQNTYLPLSSMRAVFHPGASVCPDLSFFYIKPTAVPDVAIRSTSLCNMVYFTYNCMCVSFH